MKFEEIKSGDFLEINSPAIVWSDRFCYQDSDLVLHRGQTIMVLEISVSATAIGWVRVISFGENIVGWISFLSDRFVGFNVTPSKTK